VTRPTRKKGVVIFAFGILFASIRSLPAVAGDSRALSSVRHSDFVIIPAIRVIPEEPI
jgi:hypothetical protein